MRVGHFYHRVVNTTPVTGVTNAYNAARRHTITLGSFPEGTSFIGKIEGIIVQCSAAGANVDDLTIRVTIDAAGDEALIPDTTNTMDVGITTATDKTASYQAGWVCGVTGTDTVYVWYKHEDAAQTAQIDSIAITWSE